MEPEGALVTHPGGAFERARLINAVATEWAS